MIPGPSLNQQQHHYKPNAGLHLQPEDPNHHQVSSFSGFKEPRGAVGRGNKKSETEYFHESGSRQFLRMRLEPVSVSAEGQGLVSLWVVATATVADNGWCLLPASVSVLNHFKTALQDMPLKYF